MATCSDLSSRSEKIYPFHTSQLAQNVPRGIFQLILGVVDIPLVLLLLYDLDPTIDFSVILLYYFYTKIPLAVLLFYNLHLTNCTGVVPFYD